MFDMIDDERFHLRRGWLRFQTELLLHRAEDIGRACSIGLISASGTPSGDLPSMS